MDTKPKISANGTYVFDAEDLEQLDDASLTSVLSAVVESTEQENDELKSSGIAAPSAEGDTTINAILKGPPSSNDQPPAHSRFPDKSEPAETAGDLIAPDLMFPELPRRRR